jgi:hypothetical protein
MCVKLLETLLFKLRREAYRTKFKHTNSTDGLPVTIVKCIGHFCTAALGRQRPLSGSFWPATTWLDLWGAELSYVVPTEP